MYVRTLLKSKPQLIITSQPNDTLDRAMDKLIEYDIGCLPIINEAGHICGLITAKEIFRRIHETKGKYQDIPVSSVMNHSPIIGRPDDELRYLASLMHRNEVWYVPIVDRESIVGVISYRDITKTEVTDTKIENKYLSFYMDSLHRRDLSGDN